MLSDDDKPLGVKSTLINGVNGQLNGHVTYTNGKLANGGNEESSMSEDEMPLVCVWHCA